MESLSGVLSLVIGGVVTVAIGGLIVWLWCAFIKSVGWFLERIS